MATVLAVVMCRGCKVQVFDDGTILRIDEPMTIRRFGNEGRPYTATDVKRDFERGMTTAAAAMQTWPDTWQNGPLIGWDPLR